MRVKFVRFRLSTHYPPFKNPSIDWLEAYKNKLRSEVTTRRDWAAKNNPYSADYLGGKENAFDEVLDLIDEIKPIIEFNILKEKEKA